MDIDIVDPNVAKLCASHAITTKHTNLEEILTSIPNHLAVFNSKQLDIHITCNDSRRTIPCTPGVHKIFVPTTCTVTINNSPINILRQKTSLTHPMTIHSINLTTQIHNHFLQHDNTTAQLEHFKTNLATEYSHFVAMSEQSSIPHWSTKMLLPEFGLPITFLRGFLTFSCCCITIACCFEGPRTCFKGACIMCCNTCWTILRSCYPPAVNQQDNPIPLNNQNYQHQPPPPPPNSLSVQPGSSQYLTSTDTGNNTASSSFFNPKSTSTKYSVSFDTPTLDHNISSDLSTTIEDENNKQPLAIAYTNPIATSSRKEHSYTSLPDQAPTVNFKTHTLHIQSYEPTTMTTTLHAPCSHTDSDTNIFKYTGQTPLTPYNTLCTHPRCNVNQLINLYINPNDFKRLVLQATKNGLSINQLHQIATHHPPL